MGDATVCLPLAGVIDLGAEKARLAKELGKLDDEIGRIEKKLSNPAFVEKAKEEVVEGEREKLAELSARKTQVQTAVSRLASLG